MLLDAPAGGQTGKAHLMLLDASAGGQTGKAHLGAGGLINHAQGEEFVGVDSLAIHRHAQDLLRLGISLWGAVLLHDLVGLSVGAATAAIQPVLPVEKARACARHLIIPTTRLIIIIACAMPLTPGGL